MKVNQLIVAGVCCLCLTRAFSQDSTYKVPRPVLGQVSLLYDFPQSYGLSAGVDYPIKGVIKSRISKGETRRMKEKDLFWGADLAVYRYPFNYTGILLVPHIGQRRYLRPSFFYEPSLGTGVLRTFYDGIVYEVDAAGAVKEKSLYGRFYATTQLACAFNFLLQQPGRRLLALQLKPSLWLQYPFNSFVKPHFSLEAGIRYELTTRNTMIHKYVQYTR